MINKPEITKYNPCSEAMMYRQRFTSFQEAWEQCPRGDWMLWIAQRCGVDERTLTLAKALCAKTVLHLMKEECSRKAVEVAEAYGRGNAAGSELAAAAADAAYAYAAAAADAADAADAAYADAYAADASYAAYAAADASYAAYAAAYAADAYADAAAAATAAADASYAADARTKNQKETADICRSTLTDLVITKLIP